MEAERFIAFARGLSSGADRRQLLTGLFGGSLAGLFGHTETAAKNRHGKAKKRQQIRKQARSRSAQREAVVRAESASSPSGTRAAKPVINRFGDVYSNTVPANENPCGVDLLVEGEFRVVEHLFFEAASTLVKVVGNFTDRWTTTGPAGTVRGQASGEVTTTDIVHGDGFESWVDTFRGMPGKLSAPGFGVLVHDVGNVALASTLVVNDPDDPGDDELVQEIAFEHGHFPTLPGSAQFNEAWSADYCAIVAG